MFQLPSYIMMPEISLFIYLSLLIPFTSHSLILSWSPSPKILLPTPIHFHSEWVGVPWISTILTHQVSVRLGTSYLTEAGQVSQARRLYPIHKQLLLGYSLTPSC